MFSLRYIIILSLCFGILILPKPYPVQPINYGNFPYTSANPPIIRDINQVGQPQEWSNYTHTAKFDPYHPYLQLGQWSSCNAPIRNAIATAGNLDVLPHTWTFGNTSTPVRLFRQQTYDLSSDELTIANDKFKGEYRVSTFSHNKPTFIDFKPSSSGLSYITYTKIFGDTFNRTAGHGSLVARGIEILKNGDANAIANYSNYPETEYRYYYWLRTDLSHLSLKLDPERTMKIYDFDQVLYTSDSIPGTLRIPEINTESSNTIYSNYKDLIGSDRNSFRYSHNMLFFSNFLHPSNSADTPDLNRSFICQSLGRLSSMLNNNPGAAQQELLLQAQNGLFQFPHFTQGSTIYGNLGVKIRYPAFLLFKGMQNKYGISAFGFNAPEKIKYKFYRKYSGLNNNETASNGHALVTHMTTTYQAQPYTSGTITINNIKRYPHWDVNGDTQSTFEAKADVATIKIPSAIAGHAWVVENRVTYILRKAYLYEGTWYYTYIDELSDLDNNNITSFITWADHGLNVLFSREQIDDQGENYITEAHGTNLGDVTYNPVIITP